MDPYPDLKAPCHTHDQIFIVLQNLRQTAHLALCLLYKQFFILLKRMLRFTLRTFGIKIHFLCCRCEHSKQRNWNCNSLRVWKTRISCSFCCPASGQPICRSSDGDVRNVVSPLKISHDGDTTSRTDFNQAPPAGRAVYSA